MATFESKSKSSSPDIQFLREVKPKAKNSIKSGNHGNYTSKEDIMFQHFQHDVKHDTVGTIIAIDFGTTNSVMYKVNIGKEPVIAVFDHNNSNLAPTIMSIDEEKKDIVCGYNAQYSSNIIREIKRIVGLKYVNYLFLFLFFFFLYFELQSKKQKISKNK